MERINKRKISFTRMFMRGIVVLGLCMLALSLLMLLLLQIMGRKGFFSSEIFVRMELVIVIVYITCMILFIWGVSYLVSKRITNKGRVLLEVAEQVGNQQLDFKVQPTGVTEIDVILQAMNRMKEKLADSLTTQWIIEQERQNQISALVHDLKTPITVLEGNLFLLQYETISEEGKTSVDDMTHCVNEMDYYITQLLEISRDHQLSEEITEQCEITDLIEEVLQTTQILFRKKNVQLKRSFTDKSVKILCDRKSLKRAIQNIISNALDFTPDHSCIHIEVERREKEVEVIVTDEGKGFSQSDLEHAVSQFYMGDKSRAKDKHYGLGLSISNGIVKMHQGKLKISNNANTSGGMVTITLPVLK